MFGSIISTLVANAVKTTVKSSIRIDELINKLKENCPPQQELQRIINQKNQLSDTLGLVQTNLTTLTTITNTLDKIIPPIDTVITVIKSIPVPAAIGGIGVPINLIIRLSDTLEKLKDLTQQGKVSIKGVTQAFKVISANITIVQNKLNQLDLALTLCAAQTGFTGSLSTGVSGATSNPLVNVTANQELEDRLSLNSTNPLNYKGWRLILQTDPNNTFSFPRRRVIAQKPSSNNNGIQTLISDFGLPDSNGYSYSSDTQVLVNDIKFRIDNPNWRPGSILESIDEIEEAAEAAASEAAAAAAEAARQAEELRRGKVIFFGQTEGFDNLPIGDFGGYDEGFYPVTNQVGGMESQYSQGTASRTISSVRVGRGVRITIFYNSFFLTKPGIPENDSNLQNLSRKSFEHPFNAEEDYETFYVGDEFNDHVDSFIIDKLPGGIITDSPPERLAAYEPTWVLKRKSWKELQGLTTNPNSSALPPVPGDIIERVLRFDGYVYDKVNNESVIVNKNILSAPNAQRLFYFRGLTEENVIDKAINVYNSEVSWFARWNFFTSNTPNDQHTIRYRQTYSRIPGRFEYRNTTPDSYTNNSTSPLSDNRWFIKQWYGDPNATGGQFYFEKIS